MSTKSVAGFGLILKLFKALEFTGTSSRPLIFQGMANRNNVPVFILPPTRGSASCVNILFGLVI